MRINNQEIKNAEGRIKNSLKIWDSFRTGCSPN